MNNRNQGIDVDANEPAELYSATAWNIDANEITKQIDTFVDSLSRESVAAYESNVMQRLIDSGIIVATEGAISWREGHLEHVARVYAADQRLAWRDYADDLTVALSVDGGTFAALVDKARGE